MGGERPAERRFTVGGSGKSVARCADILGPNEVKNLTRMVNSMYNGWRIEDLWLDR
jgi:hypothetical protein